MAAGGGTWSFGPVFPALSFAARLHGLRRLPPGWGALLWGRSVHGRGLADPVAVVRLDEAGTVVALRVLRPGKLVRFPGPGWLLELPGWVPTPPPGVALGVYAATGRPPNLPGWPAP